MATQEIIAGEEDRLLSEVRDSIAWITFNNPARMNAMSRDMWEGATALLDQYAADPEVRAIVLTGAGDRAFVAGADISKFENERASTDARMAYDRAVTGFHAAQARIAKPTIARVNGYCIGGGLAVAIGCDIRICSEKSTFGVPAAKLGIGYKAKGIKELERLVGPAFTAEIFYTARQFTAEEARIMGLVNRVVPEAELDAALSDLVDRIAVNAPLSIRAVKEALIEHGKLESEQDLSAHYATVEQCGTSDDYTEGRTAFMEKRRPNFTGR
ncbi:MAG: enoyl-CoA hydratase/isomerase family protein [Alphaproteobacteria bacterium]|jgi:enoyl-CoA hydratase|nr:enoyl-CoA hydratase/isomerase family protein [Alphaproteobacteria bacterium]